MAGLEQAPGTIELRAREQPRFGLDARPFDAETVAVEAEIGGYSDVLLESVVTVAGIPGWLPIERRGDVLAQPGVRIDVVSLTLVSGNRGSPREILQARALVL